MPNTVPPTNARWWRPELVDVARKIAGCEPPAWFVTNLHRAADWGLAPMHAQDRKATGRAATRDRLTAIAKAARLIVREMHNSEVSNYLERDGQFEHGSEVVHTLNLMAERADKAVEIIGSMKGRASLISKFGGVSTTTLCAHLIVEAWTVLRGKPPGAENPQAAEAAEALWRATGGAERGRGKPEDVDGLDRWRDPFRAALKMPEQDRAGLQQHLSHGRPPGQNAPENSLISPLARQPGANASSVSRVARRDLTRRRKDDA